MGEARELPRARSWAAGAVVVILQVAVVSQVPPFSGSADLVPLAAMSVGVPVSYTHLTLPTILLV